VIAGHGHRATYQAGCRCRLCRAANAAYRPTRLVDARAARAHLKALAVSAVGLAQAARLSGLHVTVLRRIRIRRVWAIQARTEARILAIPPRPALGARISPVEATRVLRALRRERYTRHQMEQQLGVRAGLGRLPGAAVTLRRTLRLRRQLRLLEAGHSSS
jgi:hypothetical protein